MDNGIGTLRGLVVITNQRHTVFHKNRLDSVVQPAVAFTVGLRGHVTPYRNEEKWDGGILIHFEAI